MAHIPVSAEYLEEFAKLADAYAALLRKWKATVTEASRLNMGPTLNGIQTLRGNLERELERATKLEGAMTVMGNRVEKAKARGAAAHAAKPKKRGSQ